MLKNKNKGFTLIELLVVIAIIGILASIVFINVNSIRTKARNSQILLTIRQMQNALELYNVSYGHYPYQKGYDDNGQGVNGLDIVDCNWAGHDEYVSLLTALLVPENIAQINSFPSPNHLNCAKGFFEYETDMPNNDTYTCGGIKWGDYTLLVYSPPFSPIPGLPLLLNNGQPYHVYSPDDYYYCLTN